ncbi:hypothetical protein Q5752_001292 [Cryptotrichosporon argae]
MLKPDEPATAGAAVFAAPGSFFDPPPVPALPPELWLVVCAHLRASPDGGGLLLRRETSPLDDKLAEPPAGRLASLTVHCWDPNDKVPRAETETYRLFPDTHKPSLQLQVRPTFRPKSTLGELQTSGACLGRLGAPGARPIPADEWLRWATGRAAQTWLGPDGGGTTTGAVSAPWPKLVALQDAASSVLAEGPT